ncbi:MAG: hypothetical protein N3I86_16120, partial [Verrucomicrobiae bacterium]|nr:hypothetical protein [Verrucomicrobiae bacterium]
VGGLSASGAALYLAMTWRQNKAASDLRFEPVASGTLLSGGWATNGVVETGREDAGAWWRVTSRDSVPVDEAPQRWMRLRVRDP